MFESYLKPPISFPTLTGSIVTFNSQYAGLPLKSHTVEVVATQSGSGTPSPDNVRPISGADSIHIQNTAGINQWDEEVVFDSAYNPRGEVVVWNNAIRNKNTFRVLENVSYYFKIGYYTIWVYWRDVNRNVLRVDTLVGSKVITSPLGSVWADFNTNSNYNYEHTYNNDISINYPATDTSYHAFVGQSITVQIGSTVYGGEYDARTGVLTVEYVKFSTTWGSMETKDVGADYTRKSITVNTGSSASPYSTNQISNVCIKQVSNELTSNHFYVNDSTLQMVLANDTSNDTIIDIVYKLATPTTIQLPPCPIDTLEGVNNIWADTGGTTLQYIKFG